MIDLKVSGGKGRVCGECTACCTTHGIREINKQAAEKCEHVCKAGCSIYQDRPESCRGYECAWLQGMFGEDVRPDKCGIVVEMQDTVMGWCWVVHEYVQGAIGDDPIATGLFDMLYNTRWPVVIVSGNNKRRILASDPVLRAKIVEISKSLKTKVSLIYQDKEEE